MKRVFHNRLLQFLLAFAPVLVIAQVENEPAVGYLRIFVDTDLVEMFLDGQSLGYTPILDQITLTPGWHTVSFFPPDFRWSHWTHRQRAVIMNVIEEGTYHVLIKPGEKAELTLFWHELEYRLEHYEAGRTVSIIIGMSMVAAVLFLLTTV